MSSSSPAVGSSSSSSSASSSSSVHSEQPPKSPHQDGPTTIAAPAGQCAVAPLIPLRQCRICLLSAETRRKPLISPCRCAGSVQHVHVHCLAHWIEVSSRKLGPPPHCELCGFRYRRRPFINLTRIRLPFMDVRDRVLNALCLLLLLIMGLCAWVVLQQVQQPEWRKPPSASPANNNSSIGGGPAMARSGGPNRASRVALSQPDATILCAVLLMFAALFLALFTQYRAEMTLFRAASRLWATNRNWRIRNYCHHPPPPLEEGGSGGGKKMEDEGEDEDGGRGTRKKMTAVMNSRMKS